jgi:anti-sigma-K factor RskA
VRHGDSDELTLLALGEPPTPGLADHLLGCADCRREVAALRHTAELARETVDQRDPVLPPEPVWARITAELDLVEAPAPTPLVRGPRHRRPPRRWRTGLAALTAAAAAAAVVVLHPWAAGSAGPTSAAALAGPGGATGEAVVVDGPGGPQLRVTARGLPLQQGYYEVWVYDGERAMVSLGTLGADSTATLPLPPTLDLRKYHVVDVSQEPYDGDQTHSDTSVLRGTLTDRPG